VAALKLRSAQVSVVVRDRVAAIDGRVRTLWDKLQVVDAARKTPGIERVESTLEIARAENDNQVAEAASREIQRYELLGIYDYVQGVVRSGTVSLTGAVTDPVKSTQLAERIAKVPGVQALDNRIAVLPTSQSDDRIRLQIGNSIYSDSLYANYSTAAPPIHIIVENGHVTLFGVVVSAIERQKAEAIARGIPGVFSVDDKIQLSSGSR
jgi:hyperosmotically inducible protein